MRARPWRVMAAALSLVVLVSGCTGLPDSGPVVDADARSSVDDARASDINAVPPVPGMEAGEVVDGFLDAMTASPIRVDVAKQFLSASAATEWEPDAGTITYARSQQLREEQLLVSVQLTDAERLGRSGGYLNRLSGAEETLRFHLTLEAGEYRITDPPDALVAPRSWFTQRYRPASLYYFDPSGRILVPQPVYVPRGPQLAANLVSRLVEGPDRDLSRVIRSYLPTGLDPRVSVDIGPDGVASVDLGGEAGASSGPAAERLLAQLAWTLRQQPGIRALRLTLGGTAVRGADGDDLYAVDEADSYDPNGADPTEELYAVRDRKLHTRDGNELVPVRGVFGSGASPVRTATPNLDGTRAAGVGLEGRSLLVADLADPGQGDPEKAAFVFRGTDLLAPAWDFADRTWVVDRAAGRAVVHVVVDGRDRVVEVAGVSGLDVRSFLVSRDGTRFVAVVRERGSDQLRVGRVEADALGDLVRVRSTRLVELDPSQSQGIDDIAWTSPTTLGLLVPIESGKLYEVRTIGVDGSPSSAESLQSQVVGPVIGLAGSPLPDLATYVVTPDSFVDLSDGDSYGFVDGSATSIDYAG
ncbi:LpqB family beta-propeller domain-containing protein [Nocardioides sp.]|uniref:LpqB family beta-propeller domain-containing protein n=1 Tax=Nocardioides sp. TaxID=35761 RepID=UPI002727D3AF|nr:LpqB family beta-propeller domain-containing protein [Nocardioides sp.]MDO9456123.1 LpqB family beta-propeller domain-containing protein [Nocardioides sp.]